MGCLTTALIGFAVFYHANASAQAVVNEPIRACVLARDVDLTDNLRNQFAQCLGWDEQPSSPVCLGSYKPLVVEPLATPDELKIMANKASFYQNKPSTLSGDVQIQQALRVVNAETARIYRDPKTNEVTRIEFLGNVRYLEPERLMIARKAVIFPQDKSGQTEDVIYRFNTNKGQAVLPAWGRASLMKRYANSDYLLKKATYTTCAPQDKAWDLEASSIKINNAKKVGVARDVTLRIRRWPVLYLPYLSFPTTKERKSGFLMPLAGYSNVGGFDFGLPYYWNIAPNYDLTLTPHLYTERGVMLGSEFRFLTEKSTGLLTGSFLPDDRAFRNFLNTYENRFEQLRDRSANRWSLGFLENTQFTPNLNLHINLQQVSDDYYFQDFSTNWALITQRQLLRQADLTYSTENWIFRGMAQSYQTLHPVNETPIADQYERLPQLLARGYYYDLPYDLNLNVVGQYDQFSWPAKWWDSYQVGMPRGPRLHFNPVVTVPLRKPWGYLTPGVEFVENYYEVQDFWGPRHTDYNRLIPRYYARGGLYFERNAANFTQTLEPSLFYLRVPYYNQSPIPIYDTANMIFNVDQLFRTNRFSGFDRIGDANQLSYAVTSRWLTENGIERANFSIGQIKYFSSRKVQLCRNLTEPCFANPYEIGQLSPFASTSPIASRGVYNFSPLWGVTGDYVWDTAISSTNNAGLNLHYQPIPESVINFGYSYLVNGDITAVRHNQGVNNSLHQAIASLAWPLSDHWSTVGAYSHNISKNYSMMSLLGFQYDNCCWAVRVLGGRTFKNLNAAYEPQYNNNVYLQILLKGLGSVANSDPSNILRTYVPGYLDPFHH